MCSDILYFFSFDLRKYKGGQNDEQEAMNTNQGGQWQVHDRFMEFRSNWMMLIGEHWLDDRGQRLEYWRIEKADSVIVLPIQHHQILLPPPTYRPGIGSLTFDFPGGRVPEGSTPTDAVPALLHRELGLHADAIAQFVPLNLVPLNCQGWPINSSFSNQKLYGFVVQIPATLNLSEACIAERYPTTSAGITSLLQTLTCLQCRAVLLEWWLNDSLTSQHKQA